ncbi:hypothetical protein NXX35_07815 [Bacteroides xylanisolvens]|nr:hypothetical protein NXX35_07815 [Bacteroides xylanisolvens]
MNMSAEKNTALLTITKVNGNGKHCRPILSLMIYCGFSHRSTRVTNKQLNSIHQNPPNHPGKYRIYKSFNRGTKVAYGEFELLP